MRPTTHALIAGLLACLANPAGSFSAEARMQQPTLAKPQATGQTIEERLDRLEWQLQLIERHLGLRLRVPLSDSRADATVPEPSTGYDRIARLEQQTRRFDDRFQQIQRRLDDMMTPGPRAPKVTQGRLVVQNMTGGPHYLSVNKVQYRVPPGRTDIWVPYQAVEAYLPSHESPKLFGMTLWRWTGRGYEMPLEIKN